MLNLQVNLQVNVQGFITEFENKGFPELSLSLITELGYAKQIISKQIAKKIQRDHKAKLDKQKGPTNPRLNPEADLVGIIHHGHNSTTRTNEVLTDYVFGEQDDKNPLQSWTFQEAQRLYFQDKSSILDNPYNETIQFQINIHYEQRVVKVKLLEPFTAADQYFYQQYLDENVNRLIQGFKQQRINQKHHLRMLDLKVSSPPPAELTYSDIINNIRDAHRELYNEDGIYATTEFDKIFKNRPRDERMLGNLIKHAQEKTTSGGRNRTFKAMQHAGYLNNVGHCISIQNLMLAGRRLRSLKRAVQ